MVENIFVDATTEPTSGRFIQLFKPFEKSENNNDKFNNTTATTDNLMKVHALDATTEDPFTIETFDALIQQHAEKGKDFILAKVVTSDPSDETKIYQSFYSAHHINKVLFRTQPEQGLLHRMRAKNPLNNMNIIGDVHYYVVKAETVKLSFPIVKSSSKSTVSNMTLSLHVNLSTVDISATSVNDDVEDNKDNLDKISIHSSPICQKSDEIIISMEKQRWSTSDALQKPQKIFKPEFSNIRRYKSSDNLSPLSFNLEKGMDWGKGIDNCKDNEICLNIINEENLHISSTTYSLSPTSDIPPSIPSQEINEKEPTSICYKAIFYATDDDFLMKTHIRQYFKANALEPSDSQLFSISASTQNLRSAITSSSRRSNNRLFPENGFLIDRIGDNNHHNDNNNLTRTPQYSGSLWVRTFRTIRENRSLQWVIFMYFLIGFLLLYFVLVKSYAVIVAFILMLCLLILFCIGNSIGIFGR